MAKLWSNWKDYMEQLLNIDNDWNGFGGEHIYEELEKLITEAEMLTAIGCLKCNKVASQQGLWVMFLKMLVMLE